MKKTFKKLSAITLLSIVFFSFHSDHSGNIDKKSRAVVNAYLNKIGGQKALLEIKSIRVIGKYINSNGEMDVEFCVQQPGKVVYNSSNKEHKTKTVYNNGKAAFYLDGKKEILSEMDLKLLERNRFIFALASLDSLQANTVYLGKKEFNKQNCTAIQINYPSGTEESYFDPKTKYLVGVISQGGSIAYYDFRSIGGIQYPYKTKIVYPNGVSMLYEISLVELNETLPDKMFELTP